MTEKKWGDDGEQAIQCCDYQKMMEEKVSPNHQEKGSSRQNPMKILPQPLHIHQLQVLVAGLDIHLKKGRKDDRQKEKQGN